MNLPDSPTLPALVRDNATATPDAPALVAGEVRWTYSELDVAVRCAAAVLAGLGVRSGENLGLLATNTATWPAIALGAMRTGARVDAFNTWAKAWDLDHLLGTSRCRVLVTESRVRSTDVLAELRELVPELWSGEPGEWRSERFPALRHVVVLGEDVPRGALSWQDLYRAAQPADREAIDARPEEPAFVLYTSGSTRYPKAVPLLHRDMILNAFHIGERMGLTAADRVWLGSPLFWSFGGANAMPATFTHGACLVMQEQFTPEKAAELLAEEQCTAAYLLPSITDALCGVADRVRAVPSLRTGATIGRPDEVRRAVEELDIPDICNVYGSTETYGNCCVTHHNAPLELRLTTQGPPLPGVELRVVDSTGRVLDAGELGELQVRGRVMPGYLGDDEANAKAITDDGWYRTGDQMRIRPDGAVEFGARLTDMIKTSGINVAPAEVESFLSAHPAVADVAVVGAPHPARGEVVIAFVTTTAEVDGEELRQYCRDGMAGYKVPWDVFVVPELPATATGKLIRRTLVEQATERMRTAKS
ncbi:fatty-acyl-CoA synthase [Modestobacter sp. DSM 44400]|uniref:class I adenylate-forming enzyme family protein n=1 Tax=Modestobacter sp. DSM 44400 TaxID=1550230 RepID=UPI00089CB208|nr:AMP-binding protein [Modestobacter sp. DSM 44400]SDX99877.1 fatty-acyl-CoA synthase [Modestobacter sp. DSM 44400]